MTTDRHSVEHKVYFVGRMVYNNHLALRLCMITPDDNLLKKWALCARAVACPQSFLPRANDWRLVLPDHTNQRRMDNEAANLPGVNTVEVYARRIATSRKCLDRPSCGKAILELKQCGLADLGQAAVLFVVFNIT